MAVKGAKERYGAICRRLYVKGWSLTSLSKRFGVSLTSLSIWKKDTHSPGQDEDDWDLARQAYEFRGETSERLYDEQQAYMLTLPVSERDSKRQDSVTKALANWKCFEEFQQATILALLDQLETNAIEVDIDRPAIFLSTLEWIAKKLQETDPEGLKVLARNFDTLVIQFKSEHAKE